MSVHPFRRVFSAAALLCVSAACADDPIAPRAPSATGAITVDANTAWAYVRFQGDSVVSVSAPPSPTTSVEWHMAFFGTNVMLNGGAAGPGSVAAFCVCANASATDAEIMAMTSATELGDFEAVVASDIPAATSFQKDVLVPVIAGWHSGSGSTAAVRPDSSWVIARGSGATRINAKFRLVSITSPTAASPGTVNFEYAIQPSVGAAFGAVQSRSVNVGTSPTYFSLVTGATSTAGADWDVAFEGYTIRLNSGVSGTGTVRGVSAGTLAFASIDAPTAGSVPTQALRSDTFGGVFATNRWYKYNITGSDNLIWPTFNVYLISVGSAVYRIQLTSYYGTTGTPRQVTMRYARIR